MKRRLMALACLAGLALSPATLAQQTVIDPQGRPQETGTLFNSICFQTWGNATLAGAAALVQGFVRLYDDPGVKVRYRKTIGRATYTVTTMTQRYSNHPGQEETCAITQEPGDVMTLAAVAAIVGGMPTDSEGELSTFVLVENAGAITVLKSGQDKQAEAAKPLGKLYEVIVSQTPATNTIMYIHHKP